MEDFRNNPRVVAATRTLMMINAALIMGVLMMAGVLMAMKRGHIEQSAGERAMPIITYVGAAAGGMMIAASLAMPGLIDTGLRRRLAVGEPTRASSMGETLARAYFMRNILIVALLEGGAMMNAVAYFLEGQLVSLVVLALLLVGMAIQWPSADRVVRWMELQARQLDPTQRSAGF